MSARGKARRRKPARADQSRSSPRTSAVAPSPPLWSPPLVALVVIGAALRLYYLRQPMRYDESVTYLYFAGQPWSTVINSYTYPNNHVFHTLLVKACVALLGNEPWVLRLPAFVAGVAMIPVTFSVGRRLFGSATAYLGAGFVSASGALAFYSTNARGYAMICLATLILADLLVRLRERPSMALWMAVVLVTALGIWTVPVMLFPAGGLALWFVLSILRDETSERRSDVARLTLAVVLTAIITVLLYSPIIVNDGMAPLTDNSFVRATPWRVFFAQIAASVKAVLASWTLGYPILIAAPIGACAMVGLIPDRTTKRAAVSMAGSMYVWCAFLLLVTHRAPFVRVWLFLVAPIALLAAHGVVRLLSLLPANQERLVSRAGEMSVVAATALAVLILASRDIETSRDTGTLVDAERIATELSGGLRPGDRVIAPVPSNGPLGYYFARAGIDTSYLSTVPNDSSRVYLIVNTAEGFTITTRLGDPLLQRFRQARLMARYPSAEIYRLY